MWPFNVKWVPDIDVTSGRKAFGKSFITINGDEIQSRQSGGSRRIYQYGDIVVKVDYGWQNEPEYWLWQQIEPEDRPNFAAVYGMGFTDDGTSFIVQERLDDSADSYHSAPNREAQQLLEKMVDKYHLADDWSFDHPGRQAKKDFNGHWKIHDYGMHSHPLPMKAAA